jgi:uncharacterized membrane protein
MNHESRACERSLAVLVAALCLFASVTYAGGPASLTNGVAVTGLSGAAGSETSYQIVVPAGQDTLEISTSGGTGDVDLYVRKDALPTTSSYDYRPYKVGNNETVDVNKPVAGTWYIMLRGYASYADVTLKATYSAAVSIKALANGVAATGLAGAAGMELNYSIDVPAGQTKLDIAMSGGTGDADLYVKKGSLPTTSSYDYRPFLVGNNESVSVDNPAAGTWYIMVRGYSAFAGITLLATYSGGTTGSVLQNGVPVTNLSGAAGSETMYRFDLPTGQANLEIKMSGGTGDADLYVRLKSPPTTSDYDYRPFLAGNDESVTVGAPAAGTWFVMIRGYIDYAGVTLKASWGDTVTPLQNGVPIINIAGALGSEQFYKIDVPSGQSKLLFTISGGTGNADMYIKKGAKPTTSMYDYRPIDNGNEENLSIGTSTGGDDLIGTWYVMLKGAQAFTGVTLSANYSAAETIMTLSNGVPVTNISGAAGAEKLYKIDVPAGQTKFEIQISGGTGDADLYVRKGSQPTTSQYDYRPYLVGNNEAVMIDNPAAATWYIMVRGYQAFAGVTLLATYGGGTPPGTVTTLQNGVAVTGLKGDTGSQTFFKIDVPAGQAKFEVAMSGGTGDADLYVKKGAKPTTSDWDYRPYLIGNNETVTIDNPAAATWYIMLNGYMAFDGVTLKATYTPVPEQVTVLTNGVAMTGLSGASGSETFYKIDVPTGQDFLRIEISGGTGDADLYVKKGAKPTLTSWDYRPYLIGNNEKVDVNSPAAATWYVMLRAYQAYAGLTLKATYGVNTPPPPPPVKGNNFASDPNCVALWRFESGKLTVDSVGKNTLTNQDVVAESGDYKEGSASARFQSVAGVYANRNWLSIADANLAPKFPGKSGTSNKRFSICFWTKLDSLPDATSEWTLVTKANTLIPESSFVIEVLPGGMVALDITSGARLQHGSPLRAGGWYHIAVTFDNASHTGTISVWDDTAQVILGTDVKKTNFPAMVNTADAFVIGSVDQVWYASMDGLMDEVVVFNDILAPSDIAKIRAGTYTKSK